MFLVHVQQCGTGTRYGYKILQKCGKKVDQYSGFQGVKRLNFQSKTNKLFGCCWNFLKGDCYAGLEDFEWFLIFFYFA